MARITVEDCIPKVENRFELVVLASQRSRDIAAGASLTVSRDNDKNPVIALREIAEDTLDLPKLRDSVVRNMQKVTFVEEIDDVELDDFTAADMDTWKSDDEDANSEDSTDDEENIDV